MGSKVEKPFIQSIIDEIKEELREDAESHVINRCRSKYKDLIQMGYFKYREEKKQMQGSSRKQMGSALDQNYEEDVIPQRERLNVMGAIMHPIDNKNYMSTIAVVNKFGELVAHKDFLHLMPPRKTRQKQDGGGQAQQMRPGEEEENAKHLDTMRQI